MQLIIKGNLIEAPIETILTKLREDTGFYYFKDIGDDRKDNIKITCPFHKFGVENHPSCFIYTKQDDPQLEYGFYKCFTCGEKGPLYKLVSHCLGSDDNFDIGKQWLVDNFGILCYSTPIFLEEITFEKKNNKKYIDESVLDEYNYIHPYMFERGLTEDVIKRFKIGYNKNTNCLTFPCWDEHNKLVMITERSVNTKRFYIPEGVDKPVYLLNFILNNNIDTVWVCESQLDALKAWTWGYPSIALFGTGSHNQYEILKKSGIRNYHLCFDGDNAGRKATVRFKKAMPKDVFIDTVQIPEGKDVNDLTFEQFSNLVLTE